MGGMSHRSIAPVSVSTASYIRSMQSHTWRRTKFVVFVWLTTTIFAVAQHRPGQPSASNVIVPPHGDSVPMLDFGGRPVVEVMINGKGPYRFILDTGASASVIDSSVAAEIAIEDRQNIQEIRIGAVSIRDLEAAVFPLSEMFGGGNAPRGVLSASAFPGTLVSFDYPAKRISFRKGILAEANAVTIFDYDGADLPSVPVKAANHEITIHLDTGAPYAVAFPTKYMKELPLARPPVQKGNVKSHGGPIPIFVAALDGDVSIGQFKLSTHEVHFTDVVPFHNVEPKGQLGGEALRDFIVTLDSVNHRVQFQRPPGASF